MGNSTRCRMNRHTLSSGYIQCTCIACLANHLVNLKFDVTIHPNLQSTCTCTCTWHMYMYMYMTFVHVCTCTSLGAFQHSFWLGVSHYCVIHCTTLAALKTRALRAHIPRTLHLHYRATWTYAVDDLHVHTGGQSCAWAKSTCIMDSGHCRWVWLR